MHALLAHAYHLAQLHAWRPFAAVVLIAGLARLAGLTRTARGAALTAAGTVVAGWCVQDPAALAWHPPPVARLPGLALLVMIDTALRTDGARRAAWWLLPATAMAASWWLRGAPMTGAAIVNCMPVFLGLAFAFPLARRLARNDPGWGSLGAALALAGSLFVTGASPHWATAALVPAAAALALLNIPQAAPALAGMVVVAAAAALVASDRGRLIPIDAACLVPLLAWVLAPRIAPRISRTGPALSGLLAATLCIALAWLATQAMTTR